MTKSTKEFRSGLYKCYLVENGKITSIDPDYEIDNETHNIHHYIKKADIKSFGQLLNESGAEQKLFVIPKEMHTDLHNDLIISDELFFKKYQIEREDLIYWKR